MFETIRFKSFGSTFLTDQIFHLGHVLIRHLDARAGRNFHIDGELARIRLREECQSEQRIDRQAYNEIRRSGSLP